MATFHSINETKKAIGKRVHHNNAKCPSGNDIPKRERLPGSGGYRICKHCRDLNK